MHVVPEAVHCRTWCCSAMGPAVRLPWPPPACRAAALGSWASSAPGPLTRLSMDWELWMGWGGVASMCAGEYARPGVGTGAWAPHASGGGACVRGHNY